MNNDMLNEAKAKAEKTMDSSVHVVVGDSAPICPDEDSRPSDAQSNKTQKEAISDTIEATLRQSGSCSTTWT